MNLKNQALQALHSSWIDILHQNYPDQKLEVGLPEKFVGLKLPVPTPSLSSWSCSFEASAESHSLRGWVLWHCPHSSLFEKALEEASRYSLVHFQCTLHPLTAPTPVVPPLAQEITPQNTIWFPMQILPPPQALTFDLGLAF